MKKLLKHFMAWFLFSSAMVNLTAAAHRYILLNNDFDIIREIVICSIISIELTTWFLVVIKK